VDLDPKRRRDNVDGYSGSRPEVGIFHSPHNPVAVVPPARFGAVPKIFDTNFRRLEQKIRHLKKSRESSTILINWPMHGVPVVAVPSQRAASARLSFDAETAVAELFRSLGYTVAREVSISGMSVDMMIERDGVRSPVEVKYRMTPIPMRDLVDVAVRMKTLETMGVVASPIIAVVGRITPEARRWSQGLGNFRLWDLDVLLEKAKPFKELYERIRALGHLGIGTDAVTLKEKTDRSAGEKLIKELEEHQLENRLTPTTYEQLCLRTIVFLFDSYLYGFQDQKYTTDGANRYDFICRIRSGNHFWDSIRSDFRTKVILFECKNYNDLITADQIYSTERYLFSGALRTVCFLISRMGADAGCERAAQAAMRESGKLVVLLSNRYLVEMIRLKAQVEGPEGYLDEKIWEFVATLPR
jgi:hypothetical protein